MKRYILSICLTVMIAGAVKAQQALTFYNMDRVLQSQFVNPSSDIKYKVQIGGTLIPIFGQLPPSIYFNYANNAIHYNHIIHYGTGNLADSLVIDPDLLLRKLKKNNHFRFQQDIELLNVGIRLNKGYLSIALTEKFRYGVSLPYDLFGLALKGNVPNMLKNTSENLSGLDVNASHYHEFAIGGSIQANDKLTIGARAKILFGLANINTINKNLRFRTNPEDYTMSLISNIEFQNSLPITFDYEFDENNKAKKVGINKESMDQLRKDSIQAAKDYLLNFSNLGLGIDFGVNYKINNKLEVFGSATDLGYIKWKSNAQIHKSEGEFVFEGLEVKPYTSRKEVEQYLKELGDSVFRVFNFNQQNTHYKTNLTGSIYFGGKYKLYEKLHLTGLYRGEFYRSNYIQSVTLGANSDLTSWLSTHVSWSYANNSIANIGLGLSARAGFMNWFIVTDNVLATIFPQQARDLNIRMGCNLVFGYGKGIKSKPKY